ncbi:bolA-like protein DDB_G0274169 isoform X2 [Choristoneura fumiferana]|uniref:bolA-like protein DDB_G0274169 isoform X2 n=1 Tax=Choristoneura fumiferana TaxID=7141 RepID=UPI003D15BE02
MLLTNRLKSSLYGVIRTGLYSTVRSMSGVVESAIRDKLQTALDATHLAVINESYMHNVPKGAETHFKVVVVSDRFDGLPLIKEELQTGVHALSIVAKTPQQWAAGSQVVESSPSCRGGFGK